MVKKAFPRFLFTILAAAFIGTSFLGDANAVPPFARKYKTNCQTCHTAFPKLNPFGLAFRASGYRFPGGDDVFIKDEPISLGAPAQKRLFPKSMWPSDLPYLPPIGLTMFSNLFIGEDNEQTTEFDGIEEIGLLAGGTLGENWSFFLDWRIFLWGQNRGWLDRAHIIYRPGWINAKFAELLGGLFPDQEIVEPAGIFNIQIGQFEPRAAPMFGGHRNLITMKGTPSAVAWPVLPINNWWGFFPNQKGVEFFGGVNDYWFQKGSGGVEWAAGIVNGEQSIKQMLQGGESDPGSPTRELGRFDDNDFKDYYGRLYYKIGGMGVMGGGAVEAAAVATENWQDGTTLFTVGGKPIKSSVKFGVFSYWGKSDFRKPGANIFNNIFDAGNQDHFTRYGADIDWIIGNFNIVGSAVVFKDNLDNDVPFNSKRFNPANPDGLDDQFKTYIYTAEIDWVIYPWLMPAVRYEWIQPDYAFTTFSVFQDDNKDGSGEFVTSQRFERLTFDVAILAAANIKLLVGTHFSIGEPPPAGSHFRDHVRVGVDIDF